MTCILGTISISVGRLQGEYIAPFMSMEEAVVANVEIVIIVRHLHLISYAIVTARNTDFCYRGTDVISDYSTIVQTLLASPLQSLQETFRLFLAYKYE